MKEKAKPVKNTPSATRACRKKIDVVEMAQKKRHLALLEKVQQGKALSGAEMKDLRGFEEKTESSAASVSVTSLERVAAAFDVSLRTVQRWVAQGMPQKEGGEYDLLSIQAWRLSRNDSDEPEQEWEVRYRKFKALLAEVQYKKVIGDLISKEEVEEGMIYEITTIKKQFLALPQRLAPQLEGLDVGARCALINDRLQEIIKEFADGKY
ncbi:MAG: hypothetical protein WCV56_06435 [Candidatus Omnitrophota bacterium]